jgi:hypothetical protein
MLQHADCDHADHLSRHADCDFGGFSYKAAQIFPFSRLSGSGAVTLIGSNATLVRSTFSNNSIGMHGFIGQGGGAAITMAPIRPFDPSASSLWLYACNFLNNTRLSEDRSLLAEGSRPWRPEARRALLGLVRSDHEWVERTPTPTIPLPVLRRQLRNDEHPSGQRKQQTGQRKDMQGLSRRARWLLQSRSESGCAAAHKLKRYVAPIARDSVRQTVYSSSGSPIIFQRSSGTNFAPLVPTAADLKQKQLITEEDAWFTMIVQVRTVSRQCPCEAVLVYGGDLQRHAMVRHTAFCAN